MNTEDRRRQAHKMFSAMPGYPFLPCPICNFDASCEHTVLERAQATHPGLVMEPAAQQH